MNTLRLLVFLAVASSVGAAERPASPVVSSYYEKPYDISTSVRTNGCRLELRRYPETYTKNKPSLQGFWVQDVFIGKSLILRVRHSAAEKEQSLVVEQNSGYGVVQVDRDLDTKYETIIVASLKDQRLTDVLLVTADGWLRHSSSDEFDSWLRRSETNKRAEEQADKAVKKALEDGSKELKK